MNKNISLNTEEIQIIFGSLLGDASLVLQANGINAYFRETHGIKQLSYLEWKNKFLERLDVCISKGKSFDKRTNKYYYYCFLRSPVFSCLTTLYPSFYNNQNKYLSVEALQTIDELGLAVWYMDDGYVGNYQSFISTQSFSYLEHLIMHKWFKERWELNAKIRNKGHLHFLEFNSRDTDKLFSIIEPYIIKEMDYKLDKYKYKYRRTN